MRSLQDSYWPWSDDFGYSKHCMNGAAIKYIPLVPLRPPKPLHGKGRMEHSVEELQTEFVNLLQKQVEALELDAYVGLTDGEWSEYYRRQERISDLDAKIRLCYGAAA
jgi:hypothetical protein